MTEKHKIDLSTLIPASAVQAKLLFKSTPGMKGLIYRFEGDATPIVATGPAHEFSINIPDTRLLFLELIGDGDWEIVAAGYTF